MRVALIAAYPPSAPAYAHRQPNRSAALARALAADGHRVTLYARQHADTPRTSILGRGASVEHVPAGPARPLPADQAARFAPQFAGYLADRWRVRRPDVVHAFSWVGGLVALGAVRDTGTPVLQTFGSLGSAERRHAVGADVSLARLRTESCVGRRASAVLAGSSDEADELARLGVPKSAVRVIPGGVDVGLFSPAGDKAPRGGRFRLVAPASGGQPHGLLAVVQALAQLPDAELVIVGGPDARRLPRTGPWREVAQLAAQLRLRSRITFAGLVPETELPALLRSADLLVSASRYEPTGMAAVQAMACGTPVVASAVGAHNDVVVDGVTGQLVAPEHPAMLAHRVRLLLARPVQLEALSIAAADRARSRYALDRISRETAAAYEWCLRRQAGSAEEDAADAEASDDAAEAVAGVVAALG